MTRVVRRVLAMLVLGSLGLGLEGATGGSGAIQDSPPRDRAQIKEPPSCRVRGRVIDAQTGSPVRRAIVVLSSEALGERQRGTLSDGNGRFELADLPAGLYSVWVDKAGYSVVRVGNDSASSLGAGRGIEVSARRVAQLTIAVTRGGVITGQLTDETGEPLVGVSVQALRPSSAGGSQSLLPVMDAQTDDRGRYRIFGLHPGVYCVSAAIIGTSTSVELDVPLGFAPTYFPGTTNPSEAERIRVDAGRELDGINIVLVQARLRRVSGSAMDSQGRPLAGGFVLLRQGEQSFGTASSVPVHGDGRFVLDRVPPGSYTLTLMDGAPDAADVETASVPIDVNDADIEGMTVVTSPPATIGGQIAFDPVPDDPTVVPERFPVAFEMVGAITFGGTASPAADGSFEGHVPGQGLAIPRPGGEWPHGWIIDTVLVGGVDVTDSGFEVQSGQQVRNVQIIVTNQTGAVTGVVLDDHDRPVRDGVAIVFPEAVPRRPELLWNYTVDRVQEGGRFSVKGLRSGAYRIVAAGADAEIDPDLVDHLRPHAVPFRLERGERRTMNVRLTRSR
jgi:hypothetical protein